MVFFNMLPKENYTKADNGVLLDPKLSDGAKILYFSLCHYRHGHQKWETNVYKDLNLSKSTYERRKKELRMAGLLLVVQEGPRHYKMYLGNSTITAQQVKEQKQPTTPPFSDLEQRSAPSELASAGSTRAETDQEENPPKPTNQLPLFK